MRLDWFRLSIAACVGAVLVHSWFGLLAGCIVSLALQNFKPLAGLSLLRQTLLSVLMLVLLFGVFLVPLEPHSLLVSGLASGARIVFADMFALAFISVPSLLLVSLMRISPEMKARIRSKRN